MERKQLYWENVEVGQEIPTSFSVKLDTTFFVVGASGTQDYYPGHHDREFAKQMGLPDIFTSTTHLEGCLSRFLTDWISPDGWLKKFRIEMRRMNVLGDTLTVKGNVTNKYMQDGEHLVDVDLWCETDREGVTTPCKATVILPARG